MFGESVRGVHVQEVGGGRFTEGARMLRFADVSARSILRAAWGCMQMPACPQAEFHRGGGAGASACLEICVRSEVGGEGRDGPVGQHRAGLGVVDGPDTRRINQARSCLTAVMYVRFWSIGGILKTR